MLIFVYIFIRVLGDIMDYKKQQKLINKVFKKVKSKFPPAELGKITPDEQETWVDIVVPQELIVNKELTELLNENTLEIRQKYYYAILFNVISHY